MTDPVTLTAEERQKFAAWLRQEADRQFWAVWHRAIPLVAQYIERHIDDDPKQEPRP